MEREIQELRKELAEKDRYIEKLENENHRINEAFVDVMQKLIDEIPEYDVRRLDKLEAIARTTDTALALTEVVHYLKNESNAIVDRVTAQLEGHVEFLHRLAATPELQSLFLISERTGSVMLPDVTKSLMLEQAAKTSEFLAGIDRTAAKHTGLGDIESVLDVNVDYNRRINEITEFVEGQASTEELKALLLQEILITSALRRYVDKLIGGGSSIGDEETWRMLVSALDKKNERYSPEKTAQLARELAGDILQAKEATGVSGKDLINYLHKSREKIIALEKSGSSEWQSWARRLYYGLTGIDPVGVHEASIRTVIGEAALTSVGVQRLHKQRLEHDF